MDLTCLYRLLRVFLHNNKKPPSLRSNSAYIERSIAKNYRQFDMKTNPVNIINPIPPELPYQNTTSLAQTTINLKTFYVSPPLIHISSAPLWLDAFSTSPHHRHTDGRVYHATAEFPLSAASFEAANLEWAKCNVRTYVMTRDK